jgi:predicted nuclease of predicted toxin-antitoxin system
LKLLVDTQLPPRLARHLEQAGHDAVHAADVPEGHLLDDRRIIEWALREQRTIVTKDRDFADHFRIKGSPPRVLLVTFGNTRNRELLSAFDTHFPVVLEVFGQGCGLVTFGPEAITGY